MKLEQIMRKFPQTVHPTDTLLAARDLMVWAGFRHLLVVDEDDALVGVLSEVDVARHQAKIGESIASSTVETVERAMTRNVHTAGPDDSIAEAAARLIDERIGCLPITRMGKVLGIVTTTDILRASVHAAMAPLRKEGPTVRDVMTPDPQVAHPDERLFDAAARMQQLRVRHLPVVDANHQVIGMLSDRDVRATLGDPSRALEERPESRADALPVRRAMTSPAVTMRPDETCSAAARAFTDLWVGAVPVVDENDVLVGILSYVDLLRAFAD